MKYRVVDLRSAYVWYCDDCAAENLTRPVFIQKGKHKQVMLLPSVVECHECGTKYRTPGRSKRA